MAWGTFGSDSLAVEFTQGTLRHRTVLAAVMIHLCCISVSPSLTHHCYFHRFYRRAHDRISCTGLLMKMSKMGVPRRFIEWLSSRFVNRTASVRVNGYIGLNTPFQVGLSQGSIFFSLLFTIYLDDILDEFEDDTFVSADADDVLIARGTSNEDMIVASLQPEVDNLVAWSAKARLTLESSKCETAFFSLHCA